jgi:hypothetical protein
MGVLVVPGRIPEDDIMVPGNDDELLHPARTVMMAREQAEYTGTGILRSGFLPDPEKMVA